MVYLSVDIVEKEFELYSPLNDSWHGIQGTDSHSIHIV